MTRRGPAPPPSVKQRLRLAVETIQAVGGTVASVEISPEGGVRVLTAAGHELASEAEGANEWDEVLSPG